MSDSELAAPDGCAIDDLRRSLIATGFDPDEHELRVMDGFDDCIAGVVERCGQEPIVCYDKERVLQRLESDGMGRYEAEEFFYVHQIGAWMGDSTPCFLSVNAELCDEKR